MIGSDSSLGDGGGSAAERPAGKSDSEPLIVDSRGVRLKLPAGVYLWCRCGRSANQPFCDGSHEGTGFEPVEFELAEPTTVRLCLCKRSDHPPFCDGAHHRI